mgnify:FL=1
MTLAAKSVGALGPMFIALSASALDAAPAPGVPVIETEDVERFYRIYDANHGKPSAEQLQRDYLDAGSDGLHTLARLRRVTGQRIADQIAADPSLYEQARRCAAVLPTTVDRLAAVTRKLSRLYPPARFPPISIAIGRGRPVGVGGPVTGLQIGLEALCGVTYFDADPADRIVHVVAHEYSHVQQQSALVDDPKPTVLQASLAEGAAEFLAELTSGGVSYPRLAGSMRGREVELGRAFLADQDSRDLSKWLYNGTMQRAGDIGYWIGYRIVRSYYRHAKSKRAAIRGIIEMRDPKAFLAASGWQPGA